MRVVASFMFWKASRGKHLFSFAIFFCCCYCYPLSGWPRPRAHFRFVCSITIPASSSAASFVLWRAHYIGVCVFILIGFSVWHFNFGLFPFIYLPKVFFTFIPLTSQPHLCATLPLILLRHTCSACVRRARITVFHPLNTPYLSAGFCIISLHIRCDYISHRWCARDIYRSGVPLVVRLFIRSYCGHTVRPDARLPTVLPVLSVRTRLNPWITSYVRNIFKLPWIMILCDTFYGNVIINNCSGSDATHTNSTRLTLVLIPKDLSLSRVRSVFFFYSSLPMNNIGCNCAIFFVCLQRIWRGDFRNDLFPLNVTSGGVHFSCEKS